MKNLRRFIKRQFLFLLLLIPTLLSSHTFTKDEDNYRKRNAILQIWSSDTTVVGEDTLYSNVIPMVDYGWHSLFVRGTSGDDSVDVTVEYQMLPDTATIYLNTTKWHTITTTTDTLGDFYQFYPALCGHMRIRYIGNVGNDVSSGSDIENLYFIWDLE